MNEGAVVYTSLNASTMLFVYTVCVNKFDRLSDSRFIALLWRAEFIQVTRNDYPI